MMVFYPATVYLIINFMYYRNCLSWESWNVDHCYCYTRGRIPCLYKSHTPSPAGHDVLTHVALLRLPVAATCYIASCDISSSPATDGRLGDEPPPARSLPE